MDYKKKLNWILDNHISTIMEDQNNIKNRCENNGCNGGRAFRIRDAMFCSPRCGNEYFNLSKDDEDYWSNEEDEEEDENWSDKEEENEEDEEEELLLLLLLCMMYVEVARPK